MKTLIQILLNGLAVYLAGLLLSGVSISSFLVAILAGIVLGLVNCTVKPVLTILTLPITFVTLGLFLIVINAAMILLVDFLLPGFHVNGWIWAILFSFLLSILNMILSPRKREQS